MVGVRQFDEDKVLTEALDVFWRKGLRATSMLDLAEATGVQRGSLYNAYHDKEELFLLAFERYEARFLDMARNALDGPDARSALTTLFKTIIANMTRGEPSRGCLTTKTATDSALIGDAVREKLRDLLDRFGHVVADALSRYASELALAPQEAAALIVTFTRGLAVMERVYQDRARLEQIASLFASTLLTDRKPPIGH
jgi:TetR/AcrR family transcriptional regulator, transcriptional repressor for nem operon